MQKRPRRALAIAAVVLGSLLVALLIIRQGSAEAATLVIVDGHRITVEDVHEYAQAFTDQDGQQRLADDYVLLSLVNRALVLDEADRRGITVTAKQLDETVSRAMQEALVRRTVERSGGIAPFRARLDTKLRFDAVREEVTATVAVSAQEALAFIKESPGQFVGMEAPNALNIARTLVLEKKSTDVWATWLAERRACADIQVEAAAVLPRETFAGTCPRR